MNEIIMGKYSTVVNSTISNRTAYRNGNGIWFYVVVACSSRIYIQLCLILLFNTIRPIPKFYTKEVLDQGDFLDIASSPPTNLQK